jgi:predicted HTH transcriptional regulator
MKEVVAEPEYKKEFEELVGDIAQATSQIQDPVAIGLMLYTIAEEKKKDNLIMRELNAKIDMLVNKIGQLEKQQTTPATTPNPAAGLSERDLEVLNFIKTHGKASAEHLQEKFKYKGKNAASARMSKLFHEGLLEKEYAGRTVYYKTR